MPDAHKVFAMGDVHGQLTKLVPLLIHAGLMDGDHTWIGGDATLWFTGDFCDRGPDGVGVLDLVMRLQQQAGRSGGNVRALLGNHELLLLAAQRFGNGGPDWGGTFMSLWEYNGGMESDLRGLTRDHIEWIEHLPALGAQDERLLMHADATFYRDFGSTIDTVNQFVRAILESDDVTRWSELLEVYFKRLEFMDQTKDGIKNAQSMLLLYGGRQIIHGHTPIPYVTRARPETVTEPMIYADGLCIDVDGGMFMGGPGFLYRLPPESTLPPSSPPSL